VTEGKSFPPRSLIIGSPAKAVRTLDDAAVRKIRENGEVYVRLGSEAGKAYREVSGVPAESSG
jgi:carbonic anhydrase/acetyltransferase-like protein (isoleucine patch superfamily)